MLARVPLTLTFALLFAFVATVPCGCAPCGPLEPVAEVASQPSDGCCPHDATTGTSEDGHDDHDVCAHCTDTDAVQTKVTADDAATHADTRWPHPPTAGFAHTRRDATLNLMGVSSRAWTDPPTSSRPPASIATTRRLAQLQILRC